MAPQAYIQPLARTTDTFQPDLFKGKVLFCTGGGSGICKGLTEAMMRHGVKAMIVGRKEDKLRLAASDLTQKTSNQDIIYAAADVRNPASLKDAVKKVLEKWGRIDYVICGAAGNFLAPISGISENGFKTVIEIDLIGTYNTIKATLPSVRESKGSYLHVSAMLHWKGTPYQAHPSAAKAGVDALSRVLAVEEGPHGVRSNVLAPGVILETEGFSRLVVDEKGTAGGDGVPSHIAAIPAGRVGRIEDCANATVFLFSPAAAFITGQIIGLDGGEWHVGGPMVPYPQGVLDPESVKHLIKGKL